MKKKVSGNFISEWFGYRVYPSVAAGVVAARAQRAGDCPFISTAVGSRHDCVKSPASRGVCSISSSSNGPRQDWLVCPYRIVGDPLIERVVERVFSASREVSRGVMPAPLLADHQARKTVLAHVKKHGVAYVYLQNKLGGEISVPDTERSPELSFDVTLAELVESKSGLAVKRFGIFETQTMDFHGSYRAVVKNLTDGLRLHGKDFHRTLAGHPDWLSEQIEGPNISNVFKRTFYQMMMKFQIALHEPCAGSALALPKSVWDSWQRHLGKPKIVSRPDGLVELRRPAGFPAPESLKNFIFIFDIDTAPSSGGPSPVKIVDTLIADPALFAHYALEVAPTAAVDETNQAVRLIDSIARRIARYWEGVELLKV